MKRGLRGKAQRLILALMLAGAMISGQALPIWGLEGQSLPAGGRIVSGRGEIARSGGAMNITQRSGRLIANWESFNIGPNASVTFRQPNTSSVVLNRISDQKPSQIYGGLSANGQVFLLNPAGVYFGPGASVSAGGLVVSSLNLSNENFLAGRYLFEKAGAAGAIVNTGTIQAAEGGAIAFISPSVTNRGTLATKKGSVMLAAGERVRLDFTGDALVNYSVERGVVDALVENRGIIRADGSMVVLTAKAADSLRRAVVNNTGIIEARTIGNRSGRILLLSDMANGETIAGGTLDASARGGDGGFIETSARKVTVKEGLRVTTVAPGGRSGTWLIDPVDYTIAASGGDMTGDDLSTNLASGNVTLDTTGAGGGNGDIFVNDSITWSANRLTLNAHRNIEINKELYGSGAAQLELKYGQGAADGVIGGTAATCSIKAPVNLPAGGNYFTQLGSNAANRKTYTVITSLGAEGSTTGTDLQGMAGNLAGNYALGGDIDASDTSAWNGGEGFTPVGTNAAKLTGVFDGLGHTISGLTINRPGTDYIGLFGCTGDATIRNVGAAGGSVTGNKYVGGLTGYNFGTITNSYSTGSVTGNSSRVGGLVGANDAGTVTKSYAMGSVRGNDTVGGLVGWNEGTITNSYATGSVSGTASSIGGLAGYNAGPITDSYATGSVSGNNIVGGLVGLNFDAGAITNSYATGMVTGTSLTGGLVGINDGGTVTNSFWNTETSGQSSSDGGTGKTTAEMRELTTFTGAGWDIDNAAGTGKTWRVYAGYTYPLLRFFLTLAKAGGPLVYNGSTSFSGSSLVWNTTVDTGKIFGSVSLDSKNVGERTVTLNGLYSNQQGYDIDLGTITIAPKGLTMSYTGADKVYDGTTAATVSGSTGDIISGDTVSFSQSAAFTDQNAGTGKTINVSGIALGGSDSNNYALRSTTATTTGSITKVPLTITARNDAKSYTGIPYSGGNGVSYAGWVNGETESVLGGALAYGGSSQGAVAPGRYTIIPSGLTAANYEIAFEQGNLEVAHRAIPLTAEPILISQIGLPGPPGKRIAPVFIRIGVSPPVFQGIFLLKGEENPPPFFFLRLKDGSTVRLSILNGRQGIILGAKGGTKGIRHISRSVMDGIVAGFLECFSNI